MKLLMLTALALAPLQEPGPKFTGNGAVNFREHVGIDQKLGDEVDLELAFRDEQGRDVELGDYFDDRPVLLALAYYECPMLCTLVLNGMVKSMRAITDLDCGDEFDVIVVSIDPGESHELAREKRASYVEDYNRGDSTAGWHFLTGDEASIEKLAKQVGFRYVYDPKSDEYAHASGIMVLTPGGELARYYYGVEYITKDLRLGLIEASEGKIGSFADKVLLLCYHYDPATGKYGIAITNITRILGALTVLIIGASIYKMVVRDRALSAQRLEEAPDVG